jgi:hypothetical protein
MAKGQKGIWVTDKEYALIAECKEMVEAFSGTRMSWGAFMCCLSFGALAAEAMSGFLRRCPNCGDEVQMVLIHPKLKRQPRAPRLPK